MSRRNRQAIQHKPYELAVRTMALEVLTDQLVDAMALRQPDRTNKLAVQIARLTRPPPCRRNANRPNAR